MDDFTLSLLSNDEVIAIDQDPLGKSATLVSEQGEKVKQVNKRPNRPEQTQEHSQGQVWAKDLEDGGKAVGLFNLGDQPMSVAADFGELKLSGRQTVRDLWRQKDVATAAGKYEATVAPHGVVLVKLTAAK